MAERICNRCNKPLLRGQAKFCSHLCANTTNTKARAAVSALAEWPTCNVDACDKRARSRKADLCPMHYHRQYRYGSLNPSHPPKYADLTGRRFGTLTLSRRVGDKWECTCDCGGTRLASLGELNRTGDSNTCGTKSNHLSEDVDYTAAHGRVKRLHGSASQHPCIDCAKPAYHWSYDHQDPDERISSTVGVAFSLNVERYQPRCVPCHKRFDLDHINATQYFAE